MRELVLLLHPILEVLKDYGFLKAKTEPKKLLGAINIGTVTKYEATDKLSGNLISLVRLYNNSATETAEARIIAIDYINAAKQACVAYAALTAPTRQQLRF